MSTTVPGASNQLHRTHRKRGCLFYITRGLLALVILLVGLSGLSDPKMFTDPLIDEIYASRLTHSARYPQAHVVTAEGAGHFIMIQHPDVVIQVVREAVEAARTGGPLAR